MTKKFLKFMAISIFLLPIITFAKEVKCTTSATFTAGHELCEKIKISCSEGSAELFAVSLRGASYVPCDENVEEGKTYALDFVWTGTLESGDTIKVDGINESDMAMGCEVGCHLYSKDYKAVSPTTNTNTNTGTNTTTNTNTNTNSNTNTAPVVVHNYQFTYDYNDGTGKTEKVWVSDDKPITKPADPTRDGYTFDGWYVDDKKFDFNTKPTKMLTLKAKWVEDTTGKTNIKFVNLTGLAAPYEGETLDSDFFIETFITWNNNVFKTELSWFRGKDKNNITEQVYGYDKHKAESGYYYQAQIRLIPQGKYSFINPKVTLNRKYTSFVKDEKDIIIKSEIYGPLKAGESPLPLIKIEDEDFRVVYNIPTWSNDVEQGTFHSMNNVFFRDHDNDADQVILLKGCARLTNTQDFKWANDPCPTVEGERNDFYGKFHNENSALALGDIQWLFTSPGTYETDIILTDEKGREYIAHYRVTAVYETPKPVKLSDDENHYLVEFLGEINHSWRLHVEELVNNDNGKQVNADYLLDNLGNLITVSNITIKDEDGAKPDGSCTLRISMNEELKQYKHFYFVNIESEEGFNSRKGEKIEGHIEGEYLVVKLPHLSTYALYGNNEGNNTILYIGIGAGAVVLIGAVVFIILKGKKKEK